jgi:hypothetical protein
MMMVGTCVLYVVVGKKLTHTAGAGVVSLLRWCLVRGPGAKRVVVGQSARAGPVAGWVGTASHRRGTRPWVTCRVSAGAVGLGSRVSAGGRQPDTSSVTGGGGSAARGPCLAVPSLRAVGLTGSLGAGESR